MTRKLSIMGALVVACAACMSAHSAAQPATSPSSTGQTAAPSATPPGYQPPSLIPPGYNPPNLLVLTPEEQLRIYARMEESYVGQTAKRGAHEAAMPTSDRPISPSITWQGRTYGDVEAFMTEARITGVLVLKHGKIVLEKYALGRTSQDRWTSFSVGKSVTSLLVGAALQDGHIQSLDEPVTKYIPQLGGSAYEGVSIRHLITMTSGVRWNEDYEDPKSDVAQSSFWPGEPGMNQLVSYMRRLPRAAAPGTVFNYSTGETDMAGILVANATGRGLAQYLSEKIWAPFGMDRDAYWVVDGGSMERGGCCISMTLRDYGRIALFVLGGGRAGEKQVVPEWYLKEATSNQLKPPAVGSYGYFWWMNGPASFAARGIFGQTISVFPADGLVIVTNAAFSRAIAPESSAAIGALVEATRAATK